MQLKKLDKTVGDNFRNVGAYEKGVNGLKNMLGGLGLAIGVGSVFSSSVRTVSEFGDAVADLSAITGATGKDLDYFKKQSIEMGVNVKGGASAVVEAYKLIAGAKPELLTNAEALNSVTEAAILLSKASGMELPEAATALTDAMNQFGADADQASKFVDVLASGAKFAAAEIPQITEALLKFGAVAKTSNVDVKESTGLIETLAEKGLKGADAGTALRNVMLKLSAPDALGKDAQDRLRAMGINFEALSDKSKPFSERLAVLKPLLKDNAALVKVFGTENAVAATTLLSSTDRIKELTSQMDSNGVALEQQEAKSKTLSEAYNRLKETFNGFILNMSEGAGAASGLSSAMDFLSKNFTTIMSVLWQGVKVWGAYRAAMLAMDLKNRFNDWRALSKGIEGATDGLEKGAAGGKKFGAALKGIGFGLAITAALELVTAFYDIASGAEAARDASARLDVQLAKSSKDAAARTSERTAEADRQINELQRLRNENKITEKEFLEQKRAITDATKNEVKADIQKVNARKAQYLEEKKALELRIKTLALDGGMQANFAIRELGFELNQVNANIQGSNTRLKEYYAELGAVGEATKDLTSDLVVETSTTNKSTAATREKTKSVQDLKNTVEDSHLTLEQMHEAELKRLEDEKAALEAIKTLSRELDAEMGGDSSLVEVDPEVFTEKQLRSMGVMTDAYKEQLQIAQQFQAALTQIATDEIDKRIELSKKEQDAAKSQQEYLEELAANGNITAQQSIAESIEIQRQAQEEQMRLEKQKQNVELISAGLQSFNSSLAAGKTPAAALAETLVSTNVLVGLLKNLNFYEKGTDNAPGGLAVVDEKGAEIITDKHGNIKEVGAGKGPRFTMLNKGDKVYNATKSAAVFDAIANADKMRPMDSAGNSFDLMQLNGSLLNIERLLKTSRQARQSGAVFWQESAKS